MPRDLHPDRSAEDVNEQYAHIGLPQERAMLNRQARNHADDRFFGRPIENAVSAIDVQPHATDHAVTTGEHSHLYPEDDGLQHFSIKRHSHNNDAEHDPHPHDSDPALRPGKLGSNR